MSRQALARQQEGLPSYRRPDIICKARSQRQGNRSHKGTRERNEGRKGSRASGQLCRKGYVWAGWLTAGQRRITALREKREAKAEKERYEQMAAKMHQKRVDRLKRREKRNKLLKS